MSKYLLLGDAHDALLQVISVQRRADLTDELLLVGLQSHAEVAYLRDELVVHRLLMFLCQPQGGRGEPCALWVKMKVTGKVDFHSFMFVHGAKTIIHFVLVFTANHTGRYLNPSVKNQLNHFYIH